MFDRTLQQFDRATKGEYSCDLWNAILARQKVVLNLCVGSVSDDGPDARVERRLWFATDLLQSFIDGADQFCLRYRADDLFLNCAALKNDQIWNAPDAVA